MEPFLAQLELLSTVDSLDVEISDELGNCCRCLKQGRNSLDLKNPGQRFSSPTLVQKFSHAFRVTLFLAILAILALPVLPFCLSREKLVCMQRVKDSMEDCTCQELKDAVTMASAYTKYWDGLDAVLASHRSARSEAQRYFNNCNNLHGKGIPTHQHQDRIENMEKLVCAPLH
jgi:hypothetical protein